MAITGEEITDIVPKSAAGIRRSFKVYPLDLSFTFVKMYLYIKKNKDDADGAAVLTKEITTALTSSGQLTKPSTGVDNLIQFYFLLTAAETGLLEPHRTYWYAFKGIASTGAPYTFVTESTITPPYPGVSATT